MSVTFIASPDSMRRAAHPALQCKRNEGVRHNISHFLCGAVIGKTHTAGHDILVPLLLVSPPPTARETRTSEYAKDRGRAFSL